MVDIDPAIRKNIQYALSEIEQEEQVRILYACESGSRAWEFASPNSDYDVRFLYVHPKNTYLRLDPPRDVIELPIEADLDINGWDLFKALRLLRNSNPPLLEWLFSPLVYQENSPAISKLREIASRSYSPLAIFHHYSRMAYNNYHQYIEQKPQVSTKKYLYVLRPIIALTYLEQHNKLAPTSFIQTLLDIQLPLQVRTEIDQLVALKQSGEELGTGPTNPVLNAFIDEHLSRWDKGAFKYADKSSFQELNELFLSVLDEVQN